jgi:hypothetical protein
MRVTMLGLVVWGWMAGCAGEACPEGVPLTDADMGCQCGTSTADALPGCGELQCNDGVLDVVGLEDGDDTAGDTSEGCG